jgi:hypothetical protein
MEISEPEPEDGLIVSNLISDSGWPLPSEEGILSKREYSKTHASPFKKKSFRNYDFSKTLIPAGDLIESNKCLIF